MKVKIMFLLVVVCLLSGGCCFVPIPVIEVSYGNHHGYRGGHSHYHHKGHRHSKRYYKSPPSVCDYHCYYDRYLREK